MADQTDAEINDKIARAIAQVRTELPGIAGLPITALQPGMLSKLGTAILNSRHGGTVEATTDPKTGAIVYNRNVIKGYTQPEIEDTIYHEGIHGEQARGHVPGEPINHSTGIGPVSPSEPDTWMGGFIQSIKKNLPFGLGETQFAEDKDNPAELEAYSADVNRTLSQGRQVKPITTPEGVGVIHGTDIRLQGPMPAEKAMLPGTSQSVIQENIRNLMKAGFSQAHATQVAMNRAKVAL